MFDKFVKQIFKKFQPVRDVEAAGTLWEDEWAFSAWLGGDALLSRLLKKSSASAASSGSPKKTINSLSYWMTIIRRKVITQKITEAF